MKERTEKLGDKAKVSATILQAHLGWAEEKWGKEVGARLGSVLDAEALSLVNRSLAPTSLAPTEQILFRDLVRIAQGIATVDGGDREAVFCELGRHSARLNLGGAYKSFVPETPHRFFEQMNFLHRTFQNFGRSTYEKTGARSCRMRLEDYAEYSPMFCLSGRGYYEEALRMMKAPGPISVTETSCQCAGDAFCMFELSW
jgi:predicted hydrocarbon binding protein